MLCNHTRRSILALALAFALPLAHAQSVGSAFTYQGELRASGTAANAAYDFQFRLYNAASGGTQLGTQVPANAVTVSNGLFTVPLNFGPAQFAGDAQWLEISVRPAGSGTFETLSPRTAVTATPYALGAVAALANSVTGTSIVDGAVQFSDVNAAQFQARVTGSCAGSQGIQSIGANGTVVCGTFSGGSGTITGVTAGTGLTGGGTSGSVTLGIANGAVGTTQINVDQVQRRVTGNCPSGQYVRIVNQDGTVVCGTDAGGAAGWGLTGNAGTDAAINFIGTSDLQPLVLRSNSVEVGRFNSFGLRVNGSAFNESVELNVRGNGGPSGNFANVLFEPTPQTSPRSGILISAGGGTSGNNNQSYFIDNLDEAGAQVRRLSLEGNGRGRFGGNNLTVGADNAVAVGGSDNTASFPNAAVVGGANNTASGFFSAALGGIGNCAGADRSVAMGSNAKVRVGTDAGIPGSGCAGVPSSGDIEGDEGSFVWSDAQGSPFVSTGDNQFNIRAAGDVNLHTSTNLSFGSQTRQMINLWGAAREFGIGVQTGTQYFRSNDSFAWFRGGSHNDAFLNPGTNGVRSMSLGPDGQLEVVNSSPTVSPRFRLSFGATGALANRFWDITASRNAVSPGGPVIPAGSLIFSDDTGIKAAFDVNGLARNASGSWTSWSDARLKTNVQDIASPLDTLLTMRGHWFEYKDPKAVMAQPGPRMGLIAQEVREAVPQWVSEGPDGMLSVTPTGFEALAIEAMRELRDESTAIDVVQADAIEALRAENAQLRARLARIEARLARQ